MPYYFDSCLLVSTNWIFCYFKENKPQTVQRCIFYAVYLACCSARNEEEQ